MPIYFRKLISRLNGISTPIGGISWEPPQLQSELARDLFLFLEDRRFLYTPFESEEPKHVVESVLQTRREFSGALKDADDDSVLSQGLVNLRAACRTFLNRVTESESGPVQLGFSYILALGELRAQFGLALARISVAYGVDLPDHLLEILPPQPLRNDKK